MTINYEKPKPHAYAIGAIVTAAAIALPITDGGWHNIAEFVAWGWAWFSSITLFIMLFMGPLDSLSDAPKVYKWIASGARLFAIAWLVYHGYHLLGALMLFAYFAAWIKVEHTRRAMESEE